MQARGMGQGHPARSCLRLRLFLDAAPVHQSAPQAEPSLGVKYFVPRIPKQGLLQALLVQRVACRGSVGGEERREKDG